jgi:hypothetical protein
MTSKCSKLAAGALLSAWVIAAAVPTVAAGQGEPAPERSLVGTWRIALTPRNCATGAPIPVPGAPFRGLYSFHEGGTMSEWLTNAAVLPTLRGPGHGAWQKATAWQHYTYSIIFNRYDESGMLTGTQEGKAELVLGDSGDDYTATSLVRIFDVDGIQISTNCASVEGTRYGG